MPAALISANFRLLLFFRARETVEEETSAGGRSHFLLQESDSDFRRDESALGLNFTNFLAEFGAAGDFSAEDVAGGDVLEVVFFTDGFAESSLPT